MTLEVQFLMMADMTLFTIIRQPSVYLEELGTELENNTGRHLHPSTVCRALQRLGLSRKLVKQSVRRCTRARAEFMTEMVNFPARMCVFIDETGKDRKSCARRYGYGFRGIRPVYKASLIQGKRESAIAAMTMDGVIAATVVEGNVDGNTFLQFLRHDLIPHLLPFDGVNPNSVVVLDNASIHHICAVTQLLTSLGVIVRFLPPYSPDMNPIEEVFSQVKSYLQANELVIRSSPHRLREVILVGLQEVTVENAISYIEHAGCGLVR